MSDSITTASKGSGSMKAGDYKLDTLSIKSTATGKELSLITMMSSLEIFEDIFSPCITARLSVLDGLNLCEFLPIRGQEIVTIKFKTDIDAGKQVFLTMRVYTVDSHKVDDSGRGQKYVLHLISEGGFWNNTKYCGYWVNGKTSSMVRSIFNKHFESSVWSGKLNIENTDDKYSFVLPAHYTPFKAITWLSTKAKTKADSSYTPFLFFESVDGYTFKSLYSLVETGNRNLNKYYLNTGNLFIGDGVNSNSPQETGDTPLPARYHKILELHEMARFNMVENMNTGKVSSSVYLHDLVTKTLLTVNLKESDIFESSNLLGSKPHFSNKDQSIQELQKNPASIDYLPNTARTAWNPATQIEDNSCHQEIYLKRKYHMNSLLSGQRLSVLVFGDSRKRVGNLIQLSVPKMSADSKAHEDKEDKNFSGVYLITAVKHTLGTAYTCKMELSRTHLEV